MYRELALYATKNKIKTYKYNSKEHAASILRFLTTGGGNIFFARSASKADQISLR